MNQELEADLVSRYPILYSQRDLSMQETCMCWGFESSAAADLAKSGYGRNVCMFRSPCSVIKKRDNPIPFEDKGIVPVTAGTNGLKRAAIVAQRRIPAIPTPRAAWATASLASHAARGI